MEIGTTLRKPETWRHLVKPVERLQKTYRLRWNLFGSKDYHLYIGCKPQFSFCVTQSYTTKQSTHNQ